MLSGLHTGTQADYQPDTGIVLHALPSRLRDVLSSLKKNSRMRRAWLGLLLESTLEPWGIKACTYSSIKKRELCVSALGSSASHSSALLTTSVNKV